MKPADVYALVQAKVGDSFVSFQSIVTDGKKSVDIKTHSVVKVFTDIIKLDNGIAISRTSGKVLGLHYKRHKATLPTYFPATKANLERAKIAKAKYTEMNIP
jgi:hypothetical protein